ncbi:MAG TPA: phytanoyl-CoA dioxygenase family protein [Chloroflexota bacterium]|nr:phytanoyl-CoA dioxygenase family protein [Chloroflexota bacterium]
MADDNAVTTGKQSTTVPPAREDPTSPAAVAPKSSEPVMRTAAMAASTMAPTTRADPAMAPARTPGSLWVTVGETIARPTNGAVNPASRVYERYRVSVQDYVTFREQGFLIVRGLVGPDDVAELAGHVDDLIFGRIDVPGLEPPLPGASVAEIEKRYLRIHMLHRVLELHERFMLHPRVLDVLEALIGPDVLAMQTMLFFKPPGGEGQGWHQDSYYIPTLPDSLCGAWIAIDRADEENGCMWFVPGTQHEPIYPTVDNKGRNHGDALSDLNPVENVSNVDDEVNTLSRVAAKYSGREVMAVMNPGDVAFFGGHVLHRSRKNRSDMRTRRSFVGHYANARSFTRWGSREGQPTNDQHILARGHTHLPFGLPRFGTPCAANGPAPSDAGPARAPLADMMPVGDMLEMQPLDPERNDPRAHED